MDCPVLLLSLLFEAPGSRDSVRTQLLALCVLIFAKLFALCELGPSMLSLALWSTLMDVSTLCTLYAVDS